MIQNSASARRLRCKMFTRIHDSTPGAEDGEQANGRGDDMFPVHRLIDPGCFVRRQRRKRTGDPHSGDEILDASHLQIGPAMHNVSCWLRLHFHADIQPDLPGHGLGVHGSKLIALADVMIHASAANASLMCQSIDKRRRSSRESDHSMLHGEAHTWE